VIKPQEVVKPQGVHSGEKQRRDVETSPAKENERDSRGLGRKDSTGAKLLLRDHLSLYKGTNVRDPGWLIAPEKTGTPCS